MTQKSYDQLAAENARLRELLSACKPYVVHNGLRIRLWELGILSDPEYVGLANDARTALFERGRAERIRPAAPSVDPAKVREALATLDGSTRAAVRLLTGLDDQTLTNLGGFADDPQGERG